MSRFFSSKYRNLVPYTPGEQPRERKYIKLNTNESPFPPSEKAVAAAAAAAAELQLYSDPTCAALTQALAAHLGAAPEEIMFMDWLCDNVEGSIPEFEQLLPSSQEMVRVLGVYRDKIPPETEEDKR